MAELVLNAEVGRELGSSSTRRLRREDKIPGVVYGLGVDPVPVAVAYRELRQVLTTEAGLNALITLKIGTDSQLSIVKELQHHPARDQVLHVDFLRVDAKQELSVDVPIVLEGEAKNVTEQNGMVDQTMFMLTILATPTTIPNELTVDVSDLEINESIRVSDIALPGGVRTEVDPDETVAVGTITRSTMESMAADAASAEEAEAAVGDEGEGGVEVGAQADDDE
ncbi:MAG: 50S ribosomal protein L25 [Acidimicrobiales bacterium]